MNSIPTQSSNTRRPWLASLLLCLGLLGLVLPLANGQGAVKTSQFEAVADLKLLAQHHEKGIQTTKQRDFSADDKEPPGWLVLIAKPQSHSSTALPLVRFAPILLFKSSTQPHLNGPRAPPAILALG